MIRGDAEECIPLDQIRNLLVVTQSCSVSAPLLNELSKRFVNVILCDEKRMPSCHIALSLYGHTESAGRIIEQSQWNKERKDLIWQHIAKEKISNQCGALAASGLQIPEQMPHYLESIAPGDSSNREALAARTYFAAMFGYFFIRNASDDINAALNYGYALIKSAMTRIVVSHGYHPALGIKHSSASNPYNLSCDLMEPFRPAVDRFVFKNKERRFDYWYKRDILSLFCLNIHYGGREMNISDAMEEFALDVLRSMNCDTVSIKKVVSYE